MKHVISLGCRCSQAATFKTLGQRRYACPFDWIFSSAEMINHCLRDDFKTFLDWQQYTHEATLFDAIGLPPGSRPRARNLIGHRVYSEMTRGVGRGAIFNHRDPLNKAEDYDYTLRTVERFRRVLASTDRKLFVVMNLNKQLWVEDDLRELFIELCQRTTNLELVALDCSRNLGPEARGMHLEELAREESEGGEGGRFLMYRLPCVGDNTGSYFREDFDADRVRSILVEPYRFALAADPLPRDVIVPWPADDNDHQGAEKAAVGQLAVPGGTAAEADSRELQRADGYPGVAATASGVPLAPSAVEHGACHDQVAELQPVVQVRRWGPRRAAAAN